jgi:hypothetical protein
LEELFERLYPPGREGPRVAGEGAERERGRWIVLFTAESLSLREANALLLQEGFHGGMRLDEVRRVERITVLGAGKTDCKQLHSLVLERTPNYGR